MTHSGAAVEMTTTKEFPVAIKFEDVDLAMSADLGKCEVHLRSLESAEALRDALSSFITFHRKVGQ